MQNPDLPKGTKVKVNPTPPGVRTSYPAADWIHAPCIVTLLDYAPNQGTLDVLYVQLANGETEAIYDFNIAHRAE